MKIAISMRAIEEIDGPGIAITNLVDTLLSIDRENTYVIFFKNSAFLGRYKEYSNVKEILIDTKRKIVFDQLFIPYYSWKEKVDLIFSPKFTVPLLSTIKSVVIQRGSEYWIFPQYYDWLDLLYVKTFLPLYCKKASAVITLSDVLKHDLNKYINISLEKIHTIYSAPNTLFKPISDKKTLENIRQKYNLPKTKFVIAITKAYSAVGSNKKEFYPRKNTEGVIDAFELVKSKTTEKIKLVLIGKDIRETLIATYGKEYVKNDDYLFPGYIPQEDMPVIYNLASVLCFPSFYESFGIPLVEAIACGCPVITSNTGACPEIIGEGGLTCDPNNINDIADSLLRVLNDHEEAAELKARALKRSNNFNWNKSANQLKQLLSQTF